MKKSNFAAMIMGTVGGMLFAIGMCMCLVPEWEAFVPGVVMGIIGGVVLLATYIIWSKANGRKIGMPLYITAGVLLFGIGMSLAVSATNIVLGIIIGIVGIIMLLSLIPLIKGLR